MMLTKVHRPQAGDRLIEKVHARRAEALREAPVKRLEIVTEIPKDVMTDEEALDLIDFLRA